MVGGQVIDLVSVGLKLMCEQFEMMYWMKMGVLLCVVVWMGVLVGEMFLMEMMVVLDVYVGVVGLVFQVVDDIFDVMIDLVMFGKMVGKDVVNDKLIYVLIFGFEVLCELVVQLCVEVYDVLKLFGVCVQCLVEFVDLVVNWVS